MVDDLSALPLRDLIALARQRLGSGTSSLKTRAEFLAALAAAAAGPEPRPAASLAPGGAPAPTLPAPAVPARARPAVVTRDFFVARPA